MPPALSPSPLAARVARRARAGGLLAPGDAVLVAASAGADSTALASLLAEAAQHGLPLRLVLGHVDHGWRGAGEAARDRESVEVLGARLGLPVACAPPPEAGRGRSEDAARRHRYRALSALAREHRCPLVATGHHARDQAETLLLRVLRGSGVLGLTGIPPQRPLHPGLRVVRPLLEVEPAELRRHLAARGLRWREDPTNADLTRERARVRARLAARAAAGGNVVPTLAAVADAIRRRIRAREERVAHLAATRTRTWVEAAAVEMPSDVLAGLRGVDLALALRTAGAPLEADRDGPWLTRRHLELAHGILRHGGDLDLPAGLVLHARGRRAWLARRRAPAPRLPRLGREDVPRAGFDLDALRTAARPETAALDAGVLGARAELRLLRPQDRFTPQGAGAGGPTRIVAWLSRRGVPRLARRGQLVVCGSRGVAWVVGRRVDRDHAVGDLTRRVARLEIVRDA